mmetsp:Transcript_15487/g.24772  ORF Transcript_15487/g.24772 Transcript_15487/m.24772 type:complete len:266 (-) Transcript_15487:805-1602(-)
MRSVGGIPDERADMDQEQHLRRAQCLLQQHREAGVPVGHKGLLLGRGFHHVSQSTQAAVDGLGLRHQLAVLICATALYIFAASQIHQNQPSTLWTTALPHYLQCEHHVRPGRSLVAERALGGTVCEALHQPLLSIRCLRCQHLHAVQEHPALRVSTGALQRGLAGGLRGSEQVTDLLAVDLEHGYPDLTSSLTFDQAPESVVSQTRAACSPIPQHAVRFAGTGCTIRKHTGRATQGGMLDPWRCSQEEVLLCGVAVQISVYLELA